MNAPHPRPAGSPSTRLEPVSTDAPAASGVGMDRVIQRRRPRGVRLAGVVLVLLAVAITAWQFLGLGGARALSVNAEHLIISEVEAGVFEDFIPVRAQVTPLETIFLDAVEGGRVEWVAVEDGAQVQEGQVLLELSNTSLQLEVISRETAVTEQLNALRSLELDLERNRQRHRSDIAAIEYEVRHQARTLERIQALFASGLVPASEVEDAEDELAFQRERLELARADQATSLDLQEEQLAHLRQAGDHLERNLELTRRNLRSLVVRAPMAGSLSGFEVEVGQSIERGRRLGQIDVPDSFKVTAEVDEFYLGRVEPGLRATFAGGGDHTAVVSRIRPQVVNGRFGLDLEFDGPAPDGIRRGQTLQLRLTLGDSEPATLIANGAFYAETAGAWVYVLEPGGDHAVKRSIRTGRRNQASIEVLDGLEPGERVITSSYASFGTMDRLDLDGPADHR